MRQSAAFSNSSRASLDDIRIVDLPGLGRDAIHDLWRRLHRKPPPKGLAGELLVRALAYRLQIDRHGGLSRGGEQRLAAAAREAARERVKAGQGAGEGDGSNAAASRTLCPGTRLVREWQGEVYEVIALAGGFLWNGESHRSLSVIAKAITGTSWNGWIFFGVERKKKRVGSTLLSTPVKTTLNELPVDASSAVNAPSQADPANLRLSSSSRPRRNTKEHVCSNSELPAAAQAITSAIAPVATPAAAPPNAASSSSGRTRSRGVRFVSFEHASAPALPLNPTPGPAQVPTLLGGR